jgi:hypothetical protein
MNGTLDFGSNIATNIGSTGSDFDTSGGLTLTLDAVAATAALVVNNSTQASAIFIAQDNGGAVFTIADGGNLTATGTLAVNGDSITADGATLTINAGGTVDVDDILNANSITSDAGVTIAAGSSYTGAGAVTLSSAASGVLTLDSSSGTVTIAAGDILSNATWSISSTGVGTSLTANDLSCTDCIGTTEIADDYLLNTGDTASGSYSFNLGAAELITIDATTPDNTGTSGALYVNLDATSSQQGINVNAEVIDDNAIDTLSGISITATNSANDSDVVYGLQVAELGGTASGGNEYAIYQAGTA